MIGMNDSLTKQKINVGIACWSLVCGVTVALLVRRFRRRVMYLACTISLLLCYISWTISMERAVHALDNDYTNQSASIATIFFIFMYSPCYNIGYNALTYTYLVELWPYALRSRGISFFQLFGRMAGFFTTFVNPIGIKNASWRYLISYCCWLAFEVVFVYFMFPETAGRTLEELAFCEFQCVMSVMKMWLTVRSQCLRTRLLLSRPMVLLRRLFTTRTWSRLVSVRRRLVKLRLWRMSQTSLGSK